MNLKGRIIDLSQEIYTGMPVYPGHMKTVIFQHMSHDECQRNITHTDFSYQTSGILMCDHGPTHIDPVRHYSRDPEAPGADRIPLENCITSAICLDVSDVPAQTQFGAAKIERELERWGLQICPGDTILFYTGHFERYYGTPEYASYQCGLNREATEYILDRGCVNFGVDSPSPDMWLDKTYPCHRVCLERGITHMENLCNLDQVAGRRFTFVGLPLRIRDGTGSPIRAVAILDEENQSREIPGL